MNGRFRFDFTYYNKTRDNALINSPFASSLPDVQDVRRFGMLKHTGTEIGVDAQFIENSMVDWHTGLTMSRNTSKIVRVYSASNVIPNPQPIDVLYPLSVRNPYSQMALNSGLTLFNGKLGIFTSITYMGGLIQHNASLAPIVPVNGTIPDSLLGPAEVVHALRWQTLSINYEMPSRFANWLRANSVGLALQGSNLGLQTNYSGIDPAVSALVTGNATVDTGQLPQPRSWQLRVTIRR